MQFHVKPSPSTQFLSAAALLLGICLCQPLTALQIRQYDPERHLRFQEGTFPGAPVTNENLWAAQHMFNGVGWSAADTRKGFALISPRHFVGANHFRPAIGSEIHFVGTDGQLRSHTYVKFYNIKNSANEDTDIFIGELAENIPASHAIPLYPILDLPESELIGRDIITYGRGDPGPRIGKGVIDTFNDSFGNAVLGSPLNDTRNYTFLYVNSLARQDDSYAEVGDSGSPSFIAVNGMLTVSGIHSAILTSPLATTTYDSFILHYKDQINDHLAATGHRIIPAPLPENITLRISSVERNGDGIVLHVDNPDQLPFDVHRTTDLTDPWDLVATSQTADVWTGEVPSDTDRVFWRLLQYPLPTASAQ